jgi:hypothetical protein
MFRQLVTVALIVALLLVFASSAQAQTCAAAITAPIPTTSASLGWTAPTQFTDNTPIGAAVITFKVYERVGAADTLRCSTTGLGAGFTSLSIGTHSWVVTASVAGVESVKTAPASKDIVAPTPGLPGNLTVQ